MKNFNQFLNGQLERIKEILSSKEKEYATESNRLHNFDSAAALLGKTPEEALLGMMTKHIVSMVDLLQHPEKATKKLADEKLTDIQNYALLAQFMLYRRTEENKPRPE